MIGIKCHYPFTQYIRQLEYLSGVYKITSVVDGKIYIGSSKELYQRWLMHCYSLNNEFHYNKNIQYSYKENGLSSLEFEVLEYCEKEKLIEREQHYLDTLLFAQEFIKTGGHDERFSTLGYNISPSAYAYARKNYTQEDRDVMRDRVIKMWNNPTKRASIVASMSGKNSKWFGEPKTEEWKKNRSIEKSGRGNPMYNVPSPTRRKIEVLNLQNGVFDFFDCMKDTAYFLKISRNTLRKYIVTGITYKGFKIFYENE